MEEQIARNREQEEGAHLRKERLPRRRLCFLASLCSVSLWSESFSSLLQVLGNVMPCTFCRRTPFLYEGTYRCTLQVLLSAFYERVTHDDDARGQLAHDAPTLGAGSPAVLPPRVYSA